MLPPGMAPPPGFVPPPGFPLPPLGALVPGMTAPAPAPAPATPAAGPPSADPGYPPPGYHSPPASLPRKPVAATPPVQTGLPKSFDPVAHGLKEGTVLKWTDMTHHPVRIFLIGIPSVSDSGFWVLVGSTSRGPLVCYQYGCRDGRRSRSSW